ncbi:hypothetical protein BKH46_00835 [Helicobacter sp. 12S02634-8]|uniref:hypothetical protein n=1 Tax=Helicobacter sp. 12S02634-8 TaxID=1476199 RepID=UPI000BC56087|nr:hypothetical protein [Helicobacter sp. 12S02634-8]PAF48488.1 hypothetical protein BKH46_00835 [Helicobacter sp. 12S02634-8]
MGIKNNIKQVQEEFRGDEKLLESAFKLERLYRKYKYVLWVIVLVLLAWFGYSKFAAYQQQKQAQKTTAIYNEVLKSPENQALLDELKKSSPDLYDLYTYAQALQNGDQKALLALKDSQNPIIKDLATYQYASYTQNLTELEKLNTTPMKDFAILQEAYLLYTKNQIPQAKSLLDQIDRTSSVYQIAAILKHYGVFEAQNTTPKAQLPTEVSQ